MEEIELSLLLSQLKIVEIFLSDSCKPAMSSTVNRSIILIRQLVLELNINH